MAYVIVEVVVIIRVTEEVAINGLFLLVMKYLHLNIVEVNDEHRSKY